MRARPIIAGILVACAAGGVLAGCGDDSGSDEGTSAATVTTETADPLPKLPRGWSTTVNEAGGYAIGVPPGWSEKQSVAKTTLRSPGSAVVVSVTADRSDEAVEAPLESYATEIAGGLENAAAPTALASPPKAGPGYEVAGAEADGGGGRVEVFVVRRPGLAAYPILVAAGPGVKPAALDPIVNRLVASLRGRPVTLGG